MAVCRSERTGTKKEPCGRAFSSRTTAWKGMRTRRRASRGR